MKIVSFLFILCIALPVAGRAQSLISFNISTETHLDKVLVSLSKQAGVNITFNPDDVKKVAIPARQFDKQPLKIILDKILSGTSFSYKLSGNRLVVFKINIVMPEKTAVHQLYVVSGHISSEDGTPMAAASIRLPEINQFFTADTKGNYNILVNGNSNITFEISYVGFQKYIQKVSISQNDTVLPVIVLKEVSLRLKDISVIANRGFEGSSNSSLMITREVIEQTPALSLNDLLNQIPNRAYAPPSLANVKNITLRANYASTTNNKGAFELNNAFGVAIVMDGNVISNNMNMQSYNPGRRGVSSAFLTSGNSYGGLSGTGSSQSFTGDYTFGGTDLRQIPVDNIESIEVVAGVASAKFGDLSDGAIIIERQAGISKGYFRTQLRDNANSYSLSKGFRLSEKAGVMNASLNYVNSYLDGRNKVRGYKRLNGNVIWTNYYGRAKRLKNTTIIDYGRNLDGVKKDPDDPTSLKVRFDSWNVSMSNRSAYRIDGRFLKSISLNLRYSEGHQYSFREYDVNKGYLNYTLATTTGIHEGTYAAGIYTAQNVIDGRPVSFNASLDINTEYTTGDITHFLTIGGNYNYGKNKGLGQVVDPEIPRVNTTVNDAAGVNYAERYYDFSRVLAQNDAGIYVENVFKTRVADRFLQVRSGVRMDIQNGFLSGSPRVNANYDVSHALKVGLAYGIAYKSPGLAQRYPGPTFVEYPVLNAYNGNKTESQSLIYVYRYDATNKELRSSQNQTLELSTHYKKNGFNVSANIYSKWSRHGISMIQQGNPIELPVYSAQFQTNAKPLLTQTGTTKQLLISHRFGNILYSNSQGIELMISTPKINVISTSFNLSTGFNRTHYRETVPTWTTVEGPSTTQPDVAKWGIYPARDHVTRFSNARITSITHIPKISLMLQFIAEANLLQNTKQAERNGIPIAYYSNAYDYVVIDKFDRNNALYGHLYKPEGELNAENVPRIIANYHLSVGKEIRKRFKFAFNVYNVFNHQPYYVTPVGTYTFPNLSPTFGAELSIKI